MSSESPQGVMGNKEIISNTLHYDAIVVLPTYPFPQEPVENGWKDLSGIVERVAGYPHSHHQTGLWIDTRLKDLAAAFMVKHGDSNTVVTLSRSIRPWMKKPYTELMKNDMRHQLSLLGERSETIVFIQEDLTKPGKGSYDLRSEIEVVAQMSKERQWRNVALISDVEHGKRVQKLIEIEKQKQTNIKGQNTLSVIAMEEILCNPDYVSERRIKQLHNMVEALHNSSFWAFWIIREFTARRAMKIVNYASKLTR
jgi:hypothetical protein